MSGKNKQNIRLSMTAPVITIVENLNTSSTNYTMALFIPEGNQVTPPTPGGDIVLEEMPQTTVYSRYVFSYSTFAFVKPSSLP